jgi:hypothetical protein
VGNKPTHAPIPQPAHPPVSVSVCGWVGGWVGGCGVVCICLSDTHALPLWLHQSPRGANFASNIPGVATLVERPRGYLPFFVFTIQPLQCACVLILIFIVIIIMIIVSVNTHSRNLLLSLSQTHELRKSAPSETSSAANMCINTDNDNTS